MLLDFSHPSVPIDFSADLAIIGSGAASLALLSRFFNDSKLNIVVLEAGSEQVEDRNQEIYRVNATEHPFKGAFDGRFRVFGGSTTRWGGQALPIDPMDLEHREWVPHSGWTLRYEELSLLYPEADRFLNLDATTYDADIFALEKTPPLPSNDDLLFRFSKWSSTPNLREVFRSQITDSKHITVLKNANLSEICLSENLKSVERLKFRTYEGKVGELRAKRFVLACGALENARLLLASNRQIPAGVGNENDLVGRFLQDHPNAYLGELSPKNKRVQDYFNYFLIGKTRFLPRFLLSEKFQRQRRTLNGCASLLFITDEQHPYSLTKDIYRRWVRGEISPKDFQPAMRLVRHLPQVALMGKKFLLDKKVYTPDARIVLNALSECTPDPDNRITLGKETDALGMPKAVLRWKLDELAAHTHREMAFALKNYLESARIGEVSLPDWIRDPHGQAPLTDVYHHIGTTRMGDSPATGVTDADGKVYGTENLYVAGSSLFPTSSHSNPTLTLIALALRLAAHLKG